MDDDAVPTLTLKLGSQARHAEEYIPPQQYSDHDSSYDNGGGMAVGDAVPRL